MASTYRSRQHTGTKQCTCLRSPCEHHGHSNTRLSEQGTRMQRHMQSKAAPCLRGCQAKRPRSPLKQSCLNKCWRYSAAQVRSWMNPAGVTPVLMVLLASEGKLSLSSHKGLTLENKHPVRENIHRRGKKVQGSQTASFKNKKPTQLNCRTQQHRNLPNLCQSRAAWAGRSTESDKMIILKKKI